MSDSTLVWTIIFVLATLVGAGIGGYIATYQMGKDALKTLDSARSDFQQFLNAAQRKLEDFEVVVPPVHVPQPVINTSISPWSAFWLGLGFVGGMIAWRLLRPAWHRAESWAYRRKRSGYGTKKRKNDK